LTIFIVVLLIITVYLLFVLPTQWLKIEHVRHDMGLNKKILQISDLHFDKLRITPGKLRKIIEQECPDYLFLSGDFTREPHYLAKAETYFRMFADSRIPAFAVLGNHDYRLPDVRVLAKLLSRYNIKLLRNESVDLDQFLLIGIDDFNSGNSSIAKSFRGIGSTSKKKLILTHDPTIVVHLKWPFDYLMAGHLHGKQFNLPLFFRFKPKGELTRRGIYKGMHTGEFGPYYISKGIGQAGINARLFVRSEVTVHDL
jgi:predicted MPP superfamily phosphohydrolase